MNTTYERLSGLLIKEYHLQPELLTLLAPLEDLGIDSLGIADLLFNVEDEFHITMPSEPVELLTLGDVVNFIDGLIAAQDGDTLPPTPMSAAFAPAP